MQINFEAVLADIVIDRPMARRNEARRTGRAALPAISRIQLPIRDALENMLWTALALSAIWALVVSVGF